MVLREVKTCIALKELFWLAIPAYAQEQSEWVFPTEKVRAHDASN